jgi:hypothetical protein
MKLTLTIFCTLLLAACFDLPRSEARDLCGDPPTIAGIATFLTEIRNKPYVCTTAESDYQRALAVSLTRQWEQCMTEVRVTDSLALRLLAARRDHIAAREAVTTWMTAARAHAAGVPAEQAPGWETYVRAEAAWKAAVTEVDAYPVIPQ